MFCFVVFTQIQRLHRARFYDVSDKDGSSIKIHAFMSGYLDMYTSQDDHDMAMEQITERITADVMQEMGADWWDSVKKGVSKAQTAVSNKTSNYRTRVLSLQEQIHEHVPELKEDIDKILVYGDIIALKKKIIDLEGTRTELKKTMNLVLEVLPVGVGATAIPHIPMKDVPPTPMKDV
jgi:hypothetical protein